MSVSSASYAADARAGARAGGCPGAGVVGADIIDLDRYMRASVRPSRHRHHHAYTRERLVVDAGAADRAPAGSGTSSSTPPPSGRDPRAPTQYYKRYSHDSGLSDDTYVKRKLKPHRRIIEKYPECHRTTASHSSEREFRATCERALRDQQEQIARVAAICEKLAQPRILSQSQDTVPPQFVQNNQQNIEYSSQNNNRVGNYDANVNPNKGNQQKLPQKGRRRPAMSDSSEMTSSTYSSRDIRRKDKHRTESCKTYNLIMGKLDELNHLFVARRLPPAAPAPPARARRSSTTVSVCDKKVATEDVRRVHTPVIQVMHSSRVSNRYQSERGKRSNSKQLAVTHAPAVDIEPVGKENGDGSIADNWRDSGCGAPGAFDLDDPLHLYAQAKRLQALHARTRNSDRHSTRRAGPLPDKRDNVDSKTSSSLCALCRGYCREVRRFLKEQLFGTCP